MLGKKMPYLPHILLAVVLTSIMSLGLGYRHLWQDEVETAERARSIVEAGLPLTIDDQDTPSINSSGKEIEEGRLHRYTPWAQFYVGAAGTVIGRTLGLSPDFSVRLPFVAAHGLAFGILSFTINHYLGAPVWLALSAASAISFQSTRVTHNRTARYHALLDLLTCLGLFALARLKAGRKMAQLLFAFVIFGLFHVQTLGGAALAAVLSVVALLVILNRAQDILRNLLICIVVPGFLGAASIALLTRFWLQGHWGQISLALPRSFYHPPTLLSALIFATVSGLIMYRKSRRLIVLTPTLVALFTILVVSLLDLHPFSQIRYYHSIALVLLFWPIYSNHTGFSQAQKNKTLKWILGVTVFSEIMLGRLGSADNFRPFQGIKIIACDFKNFLNGTKQPFHQAIDFIKEHSKPDDPILIDYVPQFVNWYLPGHPIALMPDATAKTKLNVDNPIWQKPILFPQWHVWHLKLPSGTWDCQNNECDFNAINLDLNKQTYELRSKTLGLTKKMCIEKSWLTSYQSNAPFRQLAKNGCLPEDDKWSQMIISRPCPPL